MQASLRLRGFDRHRPCMCWATTAAEEGIVVSGRPGDLQSSIAGPAVPSASVPSPCRTARLHVQTRETERKLGTAEIDPRGVESCPVKTWCIVSPAWTLYFGLF
jgi:hypothetical protein